MLECIHYTVSMPPDTLKEILALSVFAPSGDNAQPWRFEASGSTLSVFNMPEKDATPYNFHERGSYVAHGALTENIVISARHRGVETAVEYFPGQSNCTPRLPFTAPTPTVVPLFDANGKQLT